MTDPQPPRECRTRAEAAIERAPLHAVAWALLAIAAELAELRREQRKRRS